MMSVRKIIAHLRVKTYQRDLQVSKRALAMG
jgi:hypothetical protein